MSMAHWSSGIPFSTFSVLHQPFQRFALDFFFLEGEDGVTNIMRDVWYAFSFFANPSFLANASVILFRGIVLLCRFFGYHFHFLICDISTVLG